MHIETITLAVLADVFERLTITSFHDAGTQCCTFGVHPVLGSLSILQGTLSDEIVLMAEIPLRFLFS